MGDYNPNSPHVLGQQWVPIRSNPYQPDDRLERGYTFPMTGTQVADEAWYFPAETAEASARGTVQLISVYPAGTEALTGPVVSVIAPCVAGSVITGTVVLVGGATIQECVQFPSDAKFLDFDGATSVQPFATIQFSFDPSGLGIDSTRRIVGVDLLYDIDDDQTWSADNVIWRIKRPSTGRQQDMFTGIIPTSTDAHVHAGPIGEVTKFWPGNTTPDTGKVAYPWTYDNLLNFRATGPVAADQNVMELFINGAVTGFTPAFSRIHYVALRIRHCLERRVRYGGRFVAPSSSAPNPVLDVPEVVTMRNPSLTTSPSLTAGNYTLTTCSVPLGEPLLRGPAVKIYAAQELYTLPAQVPVAISRPRNVGEQAHLTDAGHIIPELTLHTAATGVITDSHPYGFQIAAPVYNGITATAELDNTESDGGAYQWVKFYARYRGDSGLGTLTIGNVATPAAAASLTVFAWQQLPQIVDGWREVILKLAVPITIAASGVSQWRWSSANDPGAPWEVLGASGIITTGAGNNSTFASYNPPNGNTINLNWKKPTALASADDTAADATFMLIREPVALVLSGSIGVLDLEPLSDLCGDDDVCVATGLYVSNLSWTHTTLIASVFAYYEVQRRDAVTGYQTIARISNLDTLTFRDMEARTDYTSTYRVRAVDTTGIVGAWSNLLDLTTPPTGVQGDSCAKSVLLFTTNMPTTGPTALAHSMVWEPGTVNETFQLPEADDNIISTAYLRDFQQVFRPLERGGEMFTRDLLVSCVAVPVPSLANIHSLRDMAWAQLPYVCVRDGIGNRWLAAVIVPESHVQQNRTKYLAKGVRIIEVTDIPAAPSAQS